LGIEKNRSGNKSHKPEKDSRYSIEIESESQFYPFQVEDFSLNNPSLKGEKSINP